MHQYTQFRNVFIKLASKFISQILGYRVIDGSVPNTPQHPDKFLWLIDKSIS